MWVSFNSHPNILFLQLHPLLAFCIHYLVGLKLHCLIVLFFHFTTRHCCKQQLNFCQFQVHLPFWALPVVLDNAGQGWGNELQEQEHLSVFSWHIVQNCRQGLNIARGMKMQIIWNHLILIFLFSPLLSFHLWFPPCFSELYWLCWLLSHIPKTDWFQIFYDLLFFFHLWLFPMFQ